MVETVVFLGATKASNSSNTKSHFEHTHAYTSSGHMTKLSRAIGVPDVSRTLQKLRPLPKKSICFRLNQNLNEANIFSHSSILFLFSTQVIDSMSAFFPFFTRTAMVLCRRSESRWKNRVIRRRMVHPDVRPTQDELQKSPY